MKAFTLVWATVVLGVTSLAFGSSGKVSVGSAAPTFDAVDSKGKSVKLDDYKGKYVVLEWCNFGCPYVQKHYNSGNMQSLQKKYTKKGVVWLTIFSSSEGHPGYLQPSELNKLAVEKKMGSTLVPDADGTIGKLYGAKNTPTMFVIDPNGHIAYMGGIDDKPTPDPEDIATAKNYVSAALDEALAGKTITTPVSRPYGCGIKYKD
ncbi:MAG: redoxin domain-containing protein [Fimbriimonas sp.]|nr:redoxin domain-containing protein [Fimbriimonas sp.]